MNVRIIVALTATLCALASSASAQGLVYVTQTAGNIGSGPEGAREGRDLGFFDAGGAQGRIWVGRRSLEMLFGDRDGNFLLDDALPDVDAIAALPEGVTGDVVGLALSLDQNFTDVLGNTILDGDVFAIGGDGIVTVHWPEAFFATLTGTSTIDVDAFHLQEDGTILFSFAEDEPTTDAALMLQNGGDGILDETTVLAIPPGLPAVILFDRATMLAMANAAFGLSLSTIVDVTGITADPVNPGAFLFAVGSGTNSIEGRVFSSHQGGSPFSLGGQAVDSPALGFADLEILQGLAWVAEAPGLSLHHPQDVVSDPAFATFIATGAAPFATVMLAATPSRWPAEGAIEVTGFSRRSFVHVDLSDPYLGMQVALPVFHAVADATGRAIWQFPSSTVPPGLALTLQAIESVSPSISPPIAVQS